MVVGAGPPAPRPGAKQARVLGAAPGGWDGPLCRVGLPSGVAVYAGNGSAAGRSDRPIRQCPFAIPRGGTARGLCVSSLRSSVFFDVLLAWDTLLQRSWCSCEFGAVLRDEGRRHPQLALADVAFAASAKYLPVSQYKRVGQDVGTGLERRVRDALLDECRAVQVDCDAVALEDHRQVGERLRRRERRIRWGDQRAGNTTA